MRFNLGLVVGVLGVSMLAGTASAQYSADAAFNFKLSNNPSEQIQPKISPTPDGGAYVAWFDNANGGYDVVLQRIDACGTPRWQENGILIADRAVSSTVDYDLITDTAGNAILAYNDDGGVSGTPQQIVMQKIDPDGNLLWGDHGVTVSSGALFKANPQLAQLSGGKFVVSWSESVSGAAQQVLLQLVEQDGTPQGASFPIAEPTNYHALSDIQPGALDSVIVLYVRGSSANPTTSAKKLWTQRYAVAFAAGVASYTPQWTAPAIILDSAVTGIGNGYFPTFITDGAGGAIFGWYEGGSPRNAYLQHILANGSLKFATPVSNAVTDTGRGRIGAAVAFAPVTGEYFLASIEGSFPTQGNYSAFVQKFSPTGVRQWGDRGITIIPQATTGQGAFINCQIDRLATPQGQGCYVALLDLVGPTTHVLKGAHIAGDSTVAFNGMLSSTVEGKARPASILTTLDNFVVAFSSGGSGFHDLYVQNLNPDGSLGNGVGVAPTPPLAINDAIGATVSIPQTPVGKPHPSFQWQKITAGVPADVVNGPTPAGSIISGATTPTLTITNAQIADSGTYRLGAANDCGESGSGLPAIVTITVRSCNLADITQIGGTVEQPGQPDGLLTVDDIILFVNLFSDGVGCPGTTPCNRADVTGIGGPPAGPDGQLTVDDVIGFVNAFGEGC